MSTSTIPSSTELAAQYDNDGYVILHNLFTRDEVKRYKAEIARVLDEVRAETMQAGQDPEQFFRSGVYVGVAARSPLFQEAVRDPRLVDVIEAIAWPNIEFWSDKVVYKNKSSDFGTPWHQDWPYWHGSNKLSIWIPLDDATVQNGCLKVIPGSHKSALEHGDTAGDGRGFSNRISPSAIDESRSVTAELEAGGAIFFHDLLLHASHPSTSGEDRWVWLPTYRNPRAEDPEYPWAVAATIVRGSY